MQKSFLAIRRGDRHANPDKLAYRFLTRAECLALQAGARVDARGTDGRIARVRVTSVQTWKTRPEVIIRWKFGMREYGAERIGEAGQEFFVDQNEEVYYCQCGAKYARWEAEVDGRHGFQYGDGESSDLLGCAMCGHTFPDTF